MVITSSRPPSSPHLDGTPLSEAAQLFVPRCDHASSDGLSDRRDSLKQTSAVCDQRFEQFGDEILDDVLPLPGVHLKARDQRLLQLVLRSTEVRVHFQTRR